MKLWILRPVDGSGHWEPWYDKAFGHIVAADDEAEARKIASTGAGDEKAAAWLDSRASTCERLRANGEARIIMTDFAAA